MKNTTQVQNTKNIWRVACVATMVCKTANHLNFEDLG
jgi:hypothetical protein